MEIEKVRLDASVTPSIVTFKSEEVNTNVMRRSG
jgi:hypothetical protein